MCSAGVDEIREMASTIKTEVLAELNATSKKLHQIASDFRLAPASRPSGER